MVSKEEDVEVLREFCLKEDLEGLRIISLQSAAGAQVTSNPEPLNPKP